MKALKVVGLGGLGLISFAVLGPFAIFPALVGLAYIAKIGPEKQEEWGVACGTA